MAVGVGSFIRGAWARVDSGIVALITDDALLLTMPPVAMELIGLEEIGDFFATKPRVGSSSTGSS